MSQNQPVLASFIKTMKVAPIPAHCLFIHCTVIVVNSSYMSTQSLYQLIFALVKFMSGRIGAINYTLFRETRPSIHWNLIKLINSTTFRNRSLLKEMSQYSQIGCKSWYAKRYKLVHIRQQRFGIVQSSTWEGDKFSYYRKFNYRISKIFKIYSWICRRVLKDKSKRSAWCMIFSAITWGVMVQHASWCMTASGALVQYGRLYIENCATGAASSRDGNLRKWCMTKSGAPDAFYLWRKVATASFITEVVELVNGGKFCTGCAGFA